MKIEQSGVAMSATHDYLYESEAQAAHSFRMVLSEASRAGEAGEADPADMERLLVFLHDLITRMLEAISGKQGAQTTELVDFLKPDRSAPVASVGEQSGRRIRMEWSTELTESVREREKTDFAAAGKVRTADGRAIDFTLGLGMCREYSCQRTVSHSGSIELRDPLVVNFNGSAAELTGRRFEFDLDADGMNELIPGLGAGSAWLAFDRNSDGRINDGSELFGTRSGDGFADLACLDDDGNCWMDEADAAFASLSLWRRDDEGKDVLTSLKDGGIGAIYLGSAKTPFALTDADNAKLGYVRASGVYLREDGGAGSVQQIDLAV